MNNALSFLNIPNASAPFDKCQNNFQIPKSSLEELYNPRVSGDTEQAPHISRKEV